MSQPQDSPPAPHGPARPEGAGGSQPPPRRPTRRPLVVWLWPVVLVGALLVSCLVASLLTQGIPDVLFRTSVTYAPEQGPPNPALLDSRPERIVERYLADYISLAGTYPCVQDPSQYDEQQDPVLAGQPCPVTRPVASYVVTSVTIRTHGLLGYTDAFVAILVTYTSGQQWASALYLGPDKDVGLVLINLHYDCWSSAATLDMFGNLVPDIPPGASYSSPDGLTSYCKDYSGHVIRG